MMDACVGWIGSIFGHRFRGRYDETRTLPQLLGAVTVDGLDLYETHRTYVADVCERCGALVRNGRT